MRTKKWMLMLLIGWLFSPIAGYAKISIAVGIIPGLLEKGLDSDNPYMQIVKQLPDANLIYLPLPRADKLFTKKRVPCIFPGSKAYIPKPELYIESAPVNTLLAYEFFRDKGSVIDDLTGKNVGIRRGLNFGKYRNRSKANFIELNSDANVLQMLYRKRTDAIVAYLPDLKAAHRKSGIRQFPYYNADTPIYKSHDALVCRISNETRNLVHAVNKLLPSMTTAGN